MIDAQKPNKIFGLMGIIIIFATGNKMILGSGVILIDSRIKFSNSLLACFEHH